MTEILSGRGELAGRPSLDAYRPDGDRTAEHHEYGDGTAARHALPSVQSQAVEDDEDVDPDSCLPVHEGPTYVMHERLREINAALEQEPTPDNNRQRMIVFSENVTEVLLPADSSDAEPPLSGGRDAPDAPPAHGAASDSGRSASGMESLQPEKADLFSLGGGDGDDNDDGGARRSLANGGPSASPALAAVRARGDKEAARALTESGALGGGGVGSGSRSVSLANGGGAVPATADEEEKVLVEMEGKFELISIRELQAMGYAMPVKDDWEAGGDVDSGGGDSSPHGSESSGGGGSSEGSAQSDSAVPSSRSGSDSEPRPPPFPRPATASARSSARRSLGGGSSSRGRPRSQQLPPPSSSEQQRSRARSAAVSPPLWAESDYRSPYGLTPEQREMKERRERLLQETQLTAQQRQKEEERRKREENEDAFRSWLRKKQEEAAASRLLSPKSGAAAGEGERSRADGGEGGGAAAAEREEAFREWVRHKKEQQEEERLLRRRKEKEEAEGYLLRTRDDCERAYREWLHRKEKELRRRKQEELAKMKVRRSARKMSRKAVKLSKAISDAQSFRYVDYYGYRF